jgi:hypothetical protein
MNTFSFINYLIKIFKGSGDSYIWRFMEISWPFWFWVFFQMASGGGIPLYGFNKAKAYKILNLNYGKESKKG